MLPGGKLTTELVGVIDLGVHFPAKLLLGRTNRRMHLTWLHRVADDHHVNVALGDLSALGHRAEDEGHANLLGDGAECLPEHVGHAEGLSNQAAELFKHRAVPVSLIVRLAAFDDPFQNAAIGQPPKLALDGTVAEGYVANNLPLVEPILDVPVEQPQHGLACCPEEGVGNRFDW